jgi:hypothetical protein
MTRPGYATILEKDSPPMMFNAGDGFHYEKLPEGTRVIYPPGPVDPLPDPNVAIERALLEPMGMEPLHELLHPGMKLTIVFDDVSCPLPPMKPPDNRQLVIEKVLEKAYAKGVEDIHLIAALGLHRRMTEKELRWALGKRIMSSFYPDRLYNYDAEDEDGNTVIGHTELGEEVRISRRAAESDLVVYVNINLVAMNGGHKSVHTGISPYSSIRHHHNAETLRNTRSLMDPPNSAMHGSINRMGEILDSAVKVFHIETTLNNATFPPVFDFMAKPEHEWSAVTKANFLVNHKATQVMPRRAARKVFQSIVAPQRMTSVQAGATHPVHEETTKHVHRQQLVPVDGQSDVLVLGVPYIGPYNVNSIMNPILVHNMVLGYLFNVYKGKPHVRESGDDRPPRGGEEVPGQVRPRPLVPNPLPLRPRLPRLPPIHHLAVGRPRPRPFGRRRLCRRRPPHDLADGLQARRHHRRSPPGCGAHRRGQPEHHVHARPERKPRLRDGARRVRCPARGRSPGPSRSRGA